MRAIFSTLLLSMTAACSGYGSSQKTKVDTEAGQRLRECSECPSMAVVPQGSFEMGAELDERRNEGASDGGGGELPVHQVEITKPFAISIHEVTRAQFAAFVDATGHKTAAKCSQLLPKDDLNANVEPDWRNPGFGQDDHHPVVCVNWYDAKAYAEWLAKLTGKPYRLLSEAEWEYAARAGAGGVRYWSSSMSACENANVADNTVARAFGWSSTHSMLFQCDDGHAFTAPVGVFTANSFGLYDMIGNVWEWVADCWHDSYQGAPTDAAPWIEADCAHRVDRSGSWNDAVWIARAAHRGMEDANIATTNLGIRVARDLP